MSSKKFSENKNVVNYKILGIIIALVILFHVSINFIKSDDSDFIISIVSFINPLAVSISSLFIAKRYGSTDVFGKAYLSLSIAFMMVFLAEVTYLVYDLILGLDPYPSIADVFFFLLYPFTLIHLFLNIRFFSPKIKRREILLLGIIFSFILFSYVYFSLVNTEEFNFDFYYGLIFVTGASATLVIALFGTMTFKEGLLGKAWLLILLGMLSLTIGDVWYYHLEIMGDYSLTHIVNLFWYAGYWVLVYSLIKHKQVI